VTPERVVFDEPVQAVFLRTVDGEAGFLAGHARLVGALVDGDVRFQREDGTEEVVTAHGGFVQVDGTQVTVLTPVVETLENGS
jgi:F-type H+-transporting ATPase subunit epsilon